MRSGTSRLTQQVIGAFVYVNGLPLGRGRIVDADAHQAQVAWFDSPVAEVAHIEWTSFDRLNKAPLQAHQRVHHIDPDTGRWQIGRIDQTGELPGEHFGADEPLYWVAFPNKDLRRVRRSELRVRWARPISDPVALLGNHSTTTPFWHAGRTQLMQALMDQRAACGGLTGLISASIDLESHQHRVVQAVLNDPVQRYLLADEVGLGKTIEAGAILRQYLLEHPEKGSALVVVPPHLRAQWEEELCSRFHLGILLGDRVRLTTLDGLGAQTDTPGMLIVDEAHHPAALAHDESAGRRAQYQRLAKLAVGTPRVLLLSATPVLRNEDGFLAMLHLLDPAAYPLDDREGFRRRVAQRQAIAEHLADLGDDASSMFMEDALNGLAELLDDDPRLLALIAAVRPLVDEDEEHPERMEALSALRTHIGELYRLHRRLLRNRRTSISEVLLERDGAQALPCPAGSGLSLHQALEEWRGDALVAVSREPGLLQEAVAIWWLFLQATLSDPRALAGLVRLRLGEGGPSPELWRLDRNARALLGRPPLLEGEARRLRDLVAAVESTPDPRSQCLRDWVQDSGEGSLVVFVDQPAVADSLHMELTSTLGERVRRHREHEDIAAFLNAEGPGILVCDRSAEEGLNLQSSRACLLHFDLPLSPNRIEQRIGRLDRYGARRRARSYYLRSEEPYTQAWQRCLDEDIQVFSRSVASLQYLLDELLQRLAQDSFENGVEAFSRLSAALQDPDFGLDKELERIRHQENLDALEADPAVQEQFEAMEELDQQPERLQQELEAWLVSRLLVRRRPEAGSSQKVRYQHIGSSESRKGPRETLIPLSDWLHFFGSSLDTESFGLQAATRAMTWSRNQAARRYVPPARLGNPLFDGAWEHARHDDRGVAFRMWRFRPGCGVGEPLLYFRVDYRVEADTGPLQEWLESHPQLSEAAVRRQLDALLPPAFLTILVSDQLEPIEDEDLRTLLLEDYAAKSASGLDYNLRLERWLQVQEQVHRGDWGQLVQDAEHSAREIAREALELRRRSERAVQRLEGLRTRREAQRGARLQRMDGPAAEVERQARHLEEELHRHMKHGLAWPDIRPDAVGAIVLADFNPFASERR